MKTLNRIFSIMNLRAMILGAFLYLRSRQHEISNYEPELKEIGDKRLDLPDYIAPIVRTGEGQYITEESGYLLPTDTPKRMKKIMHSPSFFSPVVRKFSEEDWATIICHECYEKYFESFVRKRVLKYRILRKRNILKN